MPKPKCLRQPSSRQRKPLSKEELGESSGFDRGSRTVAPTVLHFWDVVKTGGGALHDLGCHCVEAARYFFGKDGRGC
jgi:predicted dehydrogenase